MQEEVKEHTKEEEKGVKGTVEEVKEDTKEEDTKAIRGAGAKITEEVGIPLAKAPKDTKEEVKGDTEEPKDTKEEVKGGTRGGPRQEETA